MGNPGLLVAVYTTGNFYITEQFEKINDWHSYFLLIFVLRCCSLDFLYIQCSFYGPGAALLTSFIFSTFSMVQEPSGGAL